MNRLATTRLAWLPLLCGAFLFLAGCSDDFELPGAGPGTPATEITGTVTATADFAAARPGGVASLTSFLFGPAHAAVTGLTPVVGATVELVRLGDGAVIGTTTTDGDGVYTFDAAPVLGPTVAYMVRVQGEGATLRALVSGGFVDISPASEVVSEAVLDGALSFSNFELQEAAALNGLLASMDIDVSNLDFAAAVEMIRNAAGSILPGMVAGFATPGAATTLRGNDYSVINYSALLRDPLIVPAEGAPGGVDIRSGQGMMIYGFGDGDAPALGFLSEGAFLHDFSAVEAPGAEDEDASPFLSDLTDLLHVPNGQGQVLVADRRRPSASVAGIGALSESGDYLVYPLDTGVLVDGDPSIFLMGLRYAARWRGDGEAQPPVLDLALLDEAGGTVYNHMRLQQTLDGPGAGSNGVRLTTEVGTVTFDSTLRREDFSGQPADYGSFDASTLTDSLRLDLSSYSIDADSGSGAREGFYFIPAGGGLVQFRDELGGMLGWGATSSDGLRDGEILGGQMFSGGFDDPVVSAERSFSIAIRRTADMTPAALGGSYNLVEYGGYLANDADAEPPRGYVGTGIRYGMVSLDGLGGITAGPLVHKVARIDVAAARGETGALPNASGESGAFATATAGEAGETFSLIVDDTPVYTFTSGAEGDSVDAEAIQNDIDLLASILDESGIEVSGSVSDGDLVFTRPSGEPFDIEVVNEFTGTAPAAGGFSGDGFGGGVDNGAAVEPNASGASGAFTTLTAGADGEQFSLVVGGVTIFDFTSEDAGDTVAAAELQGAIDDAVTALAAEDIEVGGTVAGGDLVFTKTGGALFTMQVTNTFSGIEGTAGGFAGVDFQSGNRTITGGTEFAAAVPNASGASGGFTTLTAGAGGEQFTVVVDGVTVLNFASEDAGDTVEAAAVQAGINDSVAALSANDIEVIGTVAGGDVVFTQTDGTAFTIEVTNNFSGTPGGFDGVLAAGGEIDNGAEEIPAEPTTSGESGPFADAVASASDQIWSMTVGGVTVFTFTSEGAGDTVTAQAIQDQIDGNAGALADAGIEFTGSAVTGDLVFSREDGSDFQIIIENGFSGDAVPGGGFAGDDFAAGTREIDNGVESAANESAPSGEFEAGLAGGAGETWSMTVGDVEVVAFTSTAEGDTVTAADVQAGIEGSTTALNDAGFTFRGTATGGDLVFIRDDGEPFDIAIASSLSGRVSAAGGFAGEDFAAGERTIDNGATAGATPSLASSSEVQNAAFGNYSVSPQGVVTLTLDIGGETITGDGAVTQGGDFIAVVTGSATTDGARSGRGILFLVRQPD